MNDPGYEIHTDALPPDEIAAIALSVDTDRIGSRAGARHLMAHPVVAHLARGVLYAHAPASALEEVVALRVHLDDSFPDNGPLRVVPGSHRRGVLTDDAIREIVRSSRTADCSAPRGAVVVMRPLLVHASSKAVTPARRRVLHIEYARSLRLPDGLELAIS